MNVVKSQSGYPFKLILQTVFAGLLLMLGACASLPEEMTGKDSVWPEEIPSRDYFVQAFERDAANQQAQTRKDYLTWIVRFYRGWALYPRGWNWLTEEVVDSVSVDERAQVEGQMVSLGQRISAEWAKNRDLRSVNTNHLMIWGDALKIAVRDGSQLDLAEKISRDVDALLAREMSPDTIDLDRYLAGGAEVVIEEGDDQEVFDEPFSDPFEA